MKLFTYISHFKGFFCLGTSKKSKFHGITNRIICENDRPTDPSLRQPPPGRHACEADPVLCRMAVLLPLPLGRLFEGQDVSSTTDRMYRTHPRRNDRRKWGDFLLLALRKQWAAEVAPIHIRHLGGVWCPYRAMVTPLYGLPRSHLAQMLTAVWPVSICIKWKVIAPWWRSIHSFNIGWITVTSFWLAPGIKDQILDPHPNSIRV